MKTYIIEGVVTALSSICHNGGERNGITTQLRREKFIQPNGKVVEIPVISGNSIRGKIRDISAIDILTKNEGSAMKVDSDTFNLLFSGGSLGSTGDNTINIDKIRQLRKDIPILSVMGCSIGNVILPGKIDIGKLIPICRETLHVIPEKYHGSEEIKSIWDYCQVEMYTRKDDSKDENKREYLNEEDDKKHVVTQMMYNIETIAAGTRFYWKICLRDTSDVETGAFLSIFQKWTDQFSQVGGNGRIGHGSLKFSLTETKEIDSELDFKNDDFVKYINIYDNQKKDMSEIIENGLTKKLIDNG